MGISNTWYDSDNGKTKLQRTVNHYNTDKTNYGINLLPLENELISTSYENKIPVLQKKGQLASDLINDMPTYEEIGFDSPTVQKAKSYLDNSTDLNYNDAFENELNNSASGGEFGSSYQGFRRGTLQSNKAKELNNNALTALSTGQSIYNNNLGNAENLMNFYLNGDTIPTLGSSMGNGLISSGSNNNNALTALALSNILSVAGGGLSSSLNKKKSTKNQSSNLSYDDSSIFSNNSVGDALNSAYGNSSDYSNIASLISSPEYGYMNSGSSDSSSNPWGTVATTALKLLPYFFG